MADLTSADFDLAFNFARPQSAVYRDGDGTVVYADPGLPRFDHDAGGVPLGLLLTAGLAPGGADRAAIDPLILPFDLVGLDPLSGAEVTIMHHHDGGTGAERHAWYSRSVVKTIDALMLQAGHHLELGVVRGFLAPEFNGSEWVVRHRAQEWRLAGVLVSAGTGGAFGGIDGGDGRPLIQAGADQL